MSEKKEAKEKKKPSAEEIARIRSHGVLINDEGEYCRQVPECTCGCRADPYDYGGWRP